MTQETNYPSWWPQNPYPEDVFPMTTEDYVATIPDERQRTALSGCLGRLFWNIASKSIFEAYNNSEDYITQPLKKKTTFKELKRGDKFIGEPHGGWIFVKTDRSAEKIAVRYADGGIVSWEDDAEVFLIELAS